MLDASTEVLELTIAGRDLTIHQSPGLLRSNRSTGTTGAVVWEVTPIFAEWIASPSNIFFKHGVLGPSAEVIELGSGIAGIVGLVLAPLVRRFIFTDQEYVLKTLRLNIEENTIRSPPHIKDRKQNRNKEHKQVSSADSHVDVIPLDWEASEVQHFLRTVGYNTSDGEGASVSVILAIDCVFNESLVKPLADTCRTICGNGLRQEGTEPTICVFAQQLRSSDVFEFWLQTMMQDFVVWRMPDGALSQGLAEQSGFVVHLAVLRESLR